jgi:8-oxo-dGTP pyrophosphatase MutT (NUDIX family)
MPIAPSTSMPTEAICDVLSPLSSHKPKLLAGSTWRASVALVLRWRGPRPAFPSPPPAIDEYLAEHAARLELLFIRRATRAGDPWSGDLAFPGGRRDSDDDSDLAVAVRESREELDLGLDDPMQFRLCGRLDDVHVPVRGGGIMAAFVFLQLSEAVRCVPGPDEVAVALWAPVSCLLEGSPARAVHLFAVHSRHLGMLGRILPPRVQHWLGLTRIHYTAVDVIAHATEVILPIAPGSAATTALAADPVAKKDDLQSGDLTSPVLWGLSMAASSSLITIIGGRSHFSSEPTFVFDSRPIAALMRLYHTYHHKQSPSVAYFACVWEFLRGEQQRPQRLSPDVA